MIEALLSYYTGMAVLLVVALAATFALWDVVDYVEHGWQQYALSDSEWHRLQLHLQTEAYRDTEHY